MSNPAPRINLIAFKGGCSTPIFVVPEHVRNVQSYTGTEAHPRDWTEVWFVGSGVDDGWVIAEPLSDVVAKLTGVWT